MKPFKHKSRLNPESEYDIIPHSSMGYIVKKDGVVLGSDFNIDTARSIAEVHEETLKRQRDGKEIK